MISVLYKAFFLSVLYYTLTNRDDDTTFANILLFMIMYIALIIGARLSDIDTNLVTNAFMTKAIFTLIDDRLTQPKYKEKS